MSEIKFNTLTHGGWLIPVQIFIILDFIGWARNLRLFYGLLGEMDTLIRSMNVPDPLVYSAFIYYELAVSLVLTAGSLIVFYLFFRKSMHFPLIMTVFLAVEALMQILSLVLFGSVIPDMTFLVQKLIFNLCVSAIIIVYLFRSQRVRETFVMR